MEETSEDNKQFMREFIADGRIEIVGGGFVQNDEACPDMEMIIREIETGHNYLKNEFGLKTVKVG